MNLQTSFFAFYASFQIFVAFSFGLQEVAIKANSSALLRDKERGVGFTAFKKHEHLYLNVTPMSVVFVDIVKQCALLTAMHHSAFSFNFDVHPSLYGLHRCELLDTDLFNNTDKLANNTVFNHYSIASPCVENPCQNDGSCVATYASDDYSCTCRSGFTGKYCEKDIDECVSNPCLHNGTCNNLVGSFSCNCTTEYVGSTCEMKACKPTWTERQEVRACYKVFATKIPWTDALSACRTLGSNLTSATSLEETNFLITLVKNAIPDLYVWIGLNDIDQEGKHKWVDGSVFSFTNWKSGQPNDASAVENCVDFEIPTGIWHDFGCHNLEPYVCKYFV